MKYQIAFALTVAEPTSFSKMQGLMISADTSYRDTENDTIELEGHVQIIYNSNHLIADKVKVNLKSKSLDAIGNVSITTEKANLFGQRITLDYETNTGLIYDGYVQSGSVLFEGVLLNKIGDSEYIAVDSRYTTCDNCPESWAFSGTRIRAELGGYAYIKNSVLRVGGVPIFWLPYLVVPLKSDRQSGLLPPDFERSDTGGLAIGQSAFWAINRSQDATLNVKNYELRGLKKSLNYRYILAQNAYGQFDGATIADRAFSNDDRVNKFRTTKQKSENIDRWFVKYGHYYELPGNWVQRVQINNASDLQYPKDFPLETNNNGDPAMENRISFTKNSENHHLSMDSSYYINLLQSDPLASNSNSVHRWPEIRVANSMTRFEKSDFLYSYDFNLTHFARSDFGWDDLNQGYVKGSTDRRLSSTGDSTFCATADWEKYPECRYTRDGSYNPGTDLIRTGQRIDGKTSILRPFSVGRLDFVPKLTYRETQYRFNVGEDPTNIRRYIRTDLSARTSFSKIFPEDKAGSSYKHEIVPEVTATTIPWINHPSHAFFGTEPASETPYFSQDNISDIDLNGPYGIQFDYNDRIVERKLVTFALTNKFVEKKTPANGIANYKQFINWRIAQSYDAYQAESDIPNKQPYSDIVSDLNVNMDQLQIYQRANYYPYQRVTNSSTRTRFLNYKGDFVELGYIVSYNIFPGQEVDSRTRKEETSFAVKKSIKYVDFVGRISYDFNPPAESSTRRRISPYISSYGYGAQLRMPGECWYFTLIQYKAAGGDNNF
jgi:LPS-assembly protein